MPFVYVPESAGLSRACALFFLASTLSALWSKTIIASASCDSDTLEPPSGMSQTEVWMLEHGPPCRSPFLIVALSSTVRTVVTVLTLQQLYRTDRLSKRIPSSQGRGRREIDGPRREP